jgi:glycosyltransferase involved in cell wall biosynthesis
MKIFYDYKIFIQQSTGGPSRYFIELIKELIILQKDLKVISPIYINQYLKEIDSKYKIGFYINNRKYLGLLVELYNILFSKYLFKNKNYDILHTTYYSDFLPQSKKPKVITVYDLVHEIFSNDFNYKNFPKRKIFDQIDHFICISENTKKDLIKYYNINEKKISVTYLANFKKDLITEQSNFNLDKPFFLYVGNRKRYKNFKVLIKAYSNIANIKNNFKIICFGGDKFLKEELDYFRQNNINDENVIQLEGDDFLLTTLYKKAYALIYTSKYEGFGLPLLEAMSNRCAVISSNAGSLPEVYGGAALSFNPDSSDDLMRCLIKITDDNNYREELINLGLKRTSLFSWKKCALETYNVYKNLV